MNPWFIAGLAAGLGIGIPAGILAYKLWTLLSILRMERHE